MFSIVLLFCACSKSEDVTAPEVEQLGKNCKIISIAEDSKAISTYAYNTNGKIFKVTDVIGLGTGTFSYNNTGVTFTNSVTGQLESYTLNNSGNLILDRFNKYNYNEDGYLIEKVNRTTPNYYHYILSYDKGNLVKVIIDGFETVTMTYYEEDNQNLLGYESALKNYMLFSNSNYDIALLGKASKNRLKGIIKERILDGVFQRFVHTYTYKIDKEGKITSMNIKREGSAGDIPNINVKFTYECD